MGVTGLKMNAPKPTSSGIQTFADGQAYIPSSKRADGSTRKEIKVRPGYKPPEDVEKYKSRTAETWRTRGTGIPGADEDVDQKDGADVKSKNAKRREAARRKKELDVEEAAESVENGVAGLSIQNANAASTIGTGPSKDTQDTEQDAERQKKIRNHLKKLKAVRELKSKRAAGEKLSADQLVKISKENEIIRDLAKLEYNGSEIEESTAVQGIESPG